MIVWLSKRLFSPLTRKLELEKIVFSADSETQPWTSNKETQVRIVCVSMVAIIFLQYYSVLSLFLTVRLKYFFFSPTNFLSGVPCLV